MINLFETYGEKEKDLEYSLLKAGIIHPTVVIEDDGFLPNHIQSPVRFFTKYYTNKMPNEGGGLFFNEVPIPYYWEIKGDGNGAEIYEGYKKKGIIHYSQRKGDYRIVKSVEWLNNNEKKRVIDHYNKFGGLFKRETYSDGDLTLTTYFNSNQEEVLLVNHIINTIQVYYGEQNYLFNNFNKFFIFYCQVAKIDMAKVYYTSLSRPFFILEALQQKYPEVKYEHTLFWQENSNKMPGNMRYILKDTNSSTRHIIVQNQSEYKKIQEEWINESEVTLNYLGYIYPHRQRKTVNKSIFILTNSDQILHLEKLIKALPNYTFSIAARTTMSPKLLAFDKFAKVNLYPTVDDSELTNIISSHSIYLDINQGKEVEHIIRKAFENDLLIFAFDQTSHRKNYLDPDNLVDNILVDELTEKIKTKTRNIKSFTNALKVQQLSADQSSIEEYRGVFNEQ